MPQVTTIRPFKNLAEILIFLNIMPKGKSHEDVTRDLQSFSPNKEYSKFLKAHRKELFHVSQNISEVFRLYPEEIILLSEQYRMITGEALWGREEVALRDYDTGTMRQRKSVSVKSKEQGESREDTASNSDGSDDEIAPLRGHEDNVEEDAIAISVTGKASPKREFEERETIIPAKADELVRVLPELVTEKLHYDPKHNVFMRLNIRKSDKDIRIGEKSIAAFYEIVRLLDETIVDVRKNPHVELYLALVDSDWFKRYAEYEHAEGNEDDVAEKAATIAVTARLLQAIATRPERVSPAQIEKLLKNRYVHEVLTANPGFCERLIANLNTEHSQHFQFIPRENNVELAGLAQDYFKRGNLKVLLRETEACVLERNSKGYAVPIQIASLRRPSRKKSSSRYKDVSGQVLNPGAKENGYAHLAEDDSSSKKPVGYIIDPGSKVVILDEAGNFRLVTHEKSTFAGRNAAFQVMINLLATPNYEDREHAAGILADGAYFLNGQHWLDYLKALKANVDLAAEKGKVSDQAFVNYFAPIHHAVGKLEHFIAAIPYHHMSHRNQVKKALLDFYDKYDRELHRFYLCELRDSRLKTGSDQQFINALVNKINSKKTLDEQVLLIESLAKMAEFARQGKKTSRAKLKNKLSHMESKTREADEKALELALERVIHHLKTDPRADQLSIDAYLNKRTQKFTRGALYRYQGAPGEVVLKPAQESKHHKLLSELSRETWLQRTLRRHYQGIGAGVGIPLGVGSAILLTVVAMALFGPIVGITLGLASLIINCLIYPEIVGGFARQGLWTVGSHTITQPKYRKATVASMGVSTVLSFLLGVATTLAVIALCASTMGAGAAIGLGLFLGVLTWGGNTFLFADAFRSLCAHLDKWGVKQAWENLKTNLKSFFSFKDCHDWRDKLKKSFRMVLQPLFVTIGFALAIVSSIAFIGVLRMSFMDAMRMYTNASITVSEALANAFVRGIGLIAQLPLAIKSATKLFNDWGRSIADGLTSLIKNVGLGVRFFFKHPAEAVKLTGAYFARAGKDVANFFRREYAEFKLGKWDYVKKALFKSAVFAWVAVKFAALAGNAASNGALAGSGAMEVHAATNHLHDDAMTTLTATAAAVQSFGICKPFATARPSTVKTPVIELQLADAHSVGEAIREGTDTAIDAEPAQTPRVAELECTFFNTVQPNAGRASRVKAKGAEYSTDERLDQHRAMSAAG